MDKYFSLVEGWKIVSLLGGLSIIIPAIVLFVSQFLNQKFIHKLQNENNKQIESFKNILAQNSSFISGLSSNHSAVFQKVISERISAVNCYWENMMNIKSEFIPAISLAYEILTDDEINFKGVNGGDGSLGNMIARTEEGNFTLKTRDFSKEIEKRRHFISGTMWSLRYVYIFAIGRATHLMIDGYKKKDIVFWKHDVGFKQVLPIAFSQIEIDIIYDKKSGGIKWILESLENKMIEEINRFLSNEDFVNDSELQLRRVNEIISKNPINM